MRAKADFKIDISTQLKNDATSGQITYDSSSEQNYLKSDWEWETFEISIPTGSYSFLTELLLGAVTEFNSVQEGITENFFLL